jgi:hypothetical protein
VKTSTVCLSESRIRPLVGNTCSMARSEIKLWCFAKPQFGRGGIIQTGLLSRTQENREVALLFAVYFDDNDVSYKSIEINESGIVNQTRNARRSCVLIRKL